MRSNRKILFGLLMILGAFLFYRAFRFLSGMGGNSASGPVTAQNGSNPSLQTVSVKAPTGHIAKARVDIPANTIVTPDMMYMSPYTGPSTKAFVTDIESQGAGFITKRDIPADGQIQPSLDFIGHISETGIAGLLRPGTRAMIVPIANRPTLHDLVRIGNSVDVLAAFDGQESRTLVENVRVLGVDVSASDYPNVNAAMRGAFKAAPKANVPAGEPAAGAVAAGAPAPEGAPAPAPQPGGAPAPTPTPVPANVPRPDPALILEVTPRQAASIQLALASNAPLDFLVRPALPSNGTTEPQPITDIVGSAGVVTTGTTTSGGGASITRSVATQAVSVTKPQIAPYAEARKRAGNAPANGGRTSPRPSSGGSNGNSAPPLRRGGPLPVRLLDPPSFPTRSDQFPGPAVPPADKTSGPGIDKFQPRQPPAPVPLQTYNIPVYGDGKILRTETVPLPLPAN